MMRPLLLAAAACCALPATADSSQKKAALVRQLLRRSILAQRTVNVRGTLEEIVASGDDSIARTVKRIYHRRDGHVYSICSEPASERGTTHEEDGTWGRSYDPLTRTITVSRCAPRVLTDAKIECLLRRIEANYEVRMAGEADIAGRPCYVLTFFPRDPHAHSVKVWLDKQTAVTLSRQELKRQTGDLLCLSVYLSVDYPGSIPDSHVRGHYPARTRVIRTSLSPLYHDISSLRKAAGFEITLPTSMPRGYRFDSCEMVLLHGTRTACLRYTDGMAMVDVFESRADAQQPVAGTLLKRLPRGETLAAKIHGGTTCVVVGPRDPEGILMVARALDIHVERHLVGRLSQTARIPPSIMVAMRDRGMGLDVVAALAEISAQTGRRLDGLVSLYHDGWAWPSIATQYRANVGAVSQRVRPYECR